MDRELKMNCMYFGVRTSDRQKTKECQKCMGSNLDVFKKCTIETNILMGTSITTDEKGNTITIPPQCKISDTELMFGNDPSRVLENKQSQTGNVKEKKMAKRGVNKRQLCRDLIIQGKSDQEITQELAARYTSENVEEKVAARRAGDILKQVVAADIKQAPTTGQITLNADDVVSVGANVVTKDRHSG